MKNWVSIILLILLVITYKQIFNSSIKREYSDRFNSKEIYKEVPQGNLYSPFKLEIQPMERLLLINFDKDPDEIYVGFEPQVFNDPVHGRGLLVIAWRLDGFVDVYHQPGLTLNPKIYDITGKGLGDMVVSSLEDAKFEITQWGVDAHIKFEDKLGRIIEIKILENNRKKPKPFGLLAPMGDAVENPTSLPLVMLKDFYFVRQKETQVKIMINGKKHIPEKLPIPIDGTSMYFIRYSSQPIIATFNPAYEGILFPLEIVSKDKAKDNFLEYDLEENDGQLEIRRISTSYNQQEVSIIFNPSIPNIINIKNSARVKGQFVISSHETIGKISGNYELKRNKDKLDITITPSGGWQPNEKKLSLRFLYRVSSVFKEWPKSYYWQGSIDLENQKHIKMSSKWERIK